MKRTSAAIVQVLLLGMVTTAYADNVNHQTLTRSEQQKVNEPKSSVARDNSGVNVRDRSSVNATASDQSMNKKDTDLIRSIRRELTRDDKLSVYAHNIKIMALDGTVTLRGPVHTEKEKMEIGRMAKKGVGVHNVNNELEVITAEVN